MRVAAVLTLCLLVGELGLAATPGVVDRTISDDRYICLNSIASGLEWANGQWVLSGYTPLGQFQLQVTVLERTIGKDSKQTLRKFAWNADFGSSTCVSESNVWLEAVYGEVSCVVSGHTILFSERELRGGISSLLGATSVGATRDSLVVRPFTCQKL